MERLIIASLVMAATLLAKSAVGEGVANPRSETDAAGMARVLLWDVAADTLVNGVPPTFGPLGDSTIVESGNWPVGLQLQKDGAVTATAAVARGTYGLRYQICDRNTPPACATASTIVNVTPAPTYVEQPVSPTVIGEIQFDGARDGLYCASCNFGAGNARLAWIDRLNNLWVSGVDPVTGAFDPITGQGSGTPVDTTAYYWSDLGSGPQWAFSTPPRAPGGDPVSQLVYTRYAPGTPDEYDYSGAALATQTGASTWDTGFFPGAYAAHTNNTLLPQPSQCQTDAGATAIFETLGDPGNPGQREFIESVSMAPGTAPTQVPFGAGGAVASDHWVPCTAWLTFEQTVVTGAQSFQQVYWYDRSTQAVQQLTFDAVSKQGTQLFRAPDYGGNYVLITVAADNTLQIYEQLNGATYSSGAPVMTLLADVSSPDPAEPYLIDPQAFIHCTAQAPTCQTYLLVGLGTSPNSAKTVTEPNGLALMSLDPTNQGFAILAARSTPAVQRLNPAYFITSQYGPVVMYERVQTLSATQPYQEQGIYQINLQLGVPSGPCVGSSAATGLNPTWPKCTPPAWRMRKREL